MAVELHNSDSVLLPQFLTDGRNSVPVNSKPIKQNWSSCSSFSDFGSPLSSPVESELASTESESDQDDYYIAELSRQMANSMLQDDDNKNEETWSAVISSPQSTFRSRLDSNQEEVSMMGKLKVNEEMNTNSSSENVIGTSLKATVAPLVLRNPKNSMVEFPSKQALIDDQIRAVQLKREQIMKQQEQPLNWGKRQMEPKQQIREFQRKGRACGGFNNGEKCSWSNPQQQQGTGSEMRAVFLGEPGSRRGTGVFLPREIGTASESCKKRGCSTVLIPGRVLQALKLHFDKMDGGSRSYGASYPFQHDPRMGDIWYGLQLQQQQPKSPSRTVVSATTDHHQEMSLPQEWTY